MLSKALEMAVSTGVPFWGTWRDIPLLGPLREGINLVIYGNIYEEFERYVKEELVNRQLSIGALLEKLEGVRVLGLLRDPEDIKS
jgi:hypothetical protein